jgi:hypothetical protein
VNNNGNVNADGNNVNNNNVGVRPAFSHGLKSFLMQERPVRREKGTVFPLWP